MYDMETIVDTVLYVWRVIIEKVSSFLHMKKIYSYVVVDIN